MDEMHLWVYVKFGCGLFIAGKMRSKKSGTFFKG
jgi:hypothetical protein